MATATKATPKKTPATKATPNKTPKSTPKQPVPKPKVIIKKQVGRPKLPSDQKVGRPQKPLVQKIPSGFKTAATGDTSGSPGTASNIVFILGIGLIIASGFSSQRIPKAFKWTWGAGGTDASVFVTFLRITGVQLLAIFILSFLARASSTLGRIFIVVFVGIWILWLMKNPQITQLLAAAAKE